MLRNRRRERRRDQHEVPTDLAELESQPASHAADFESQPLQDALEQLSPHSREPGHDAPTRPRLCRWEGSHGSMRDPCIHGYRTGFIRPDDILGKVAARSSVGIPKKLLGFLGGLLKPVVTWMASTTEAGA